MSASSRSWRSSARGSRSPMRGSSSSRSSPSRGALRGNTASSSPSRQTTRCGTERIGTSVQIVRCPVRKFARVGRPSRRSASRARTSASASGVRLASASPATSSRMRCSSARCQASRGARVAEEVGGAGDHAGPGVDRLRGGEVVEHRPEAVDELGEPAGQVDRAALDVVERQDPVDEAAVVLGHRHADEHARDAVVPRPLAEVLEAERPAVGGVEAPADAALGHPLLEPHDVVVVEAEAAADRLAARQVEHLRGGDAPVRELEQLGDDPEQRVGPQQRAVGEADAQVGRRGPPAARRRPRPRPARRRTSRG